MRGTLQRRHVMEQLHLYDGDKVPEEVMKNITNQIRPQRPVPVKLNSYTDEQITSFPRVVDFPKDYVPR